jgi:hypothetical protein
VKRQHDFTQEVVPAEHVAVPDTHPHGATLDLVQRHLELKTKKVKKLEFILGVKTVNSVSSFGNWEQG